MKSELKRRGRGAVALEKIKQQRHTVSSVDNRKLEERWYPFKVQRSSTCGLSVCWLSSAVLDHQSRYSVTFIFMQLLGDCFSYINPHLSYFSSLTWHLTSFYKTQNKTYLQTAWHIVKCLNTFSAQERLILYGYTFVFIVDIHVMDACPPIKAVQ